MAEETEGRIDYLKNIIRCSRIISMWPDDNPTLFQKRKHRFIVFFNFIYFALFVSGIIVKIILFHTNMDGISAAVDHVTVFVSAMFRYVYVYFRGKKYLEYHRMILEGFIHRPLFDENAPGADEVFNGYYNRAKLVIMGYNVPVILWNLQKLSRPVVNFLAERVQRSLVDPENDTPIPLEAPMLSYFPMNVKTTAGSVLLYFWEVYPLLSFAFIYICVDDFWYMSLMLTIGQFELLKRSYESVGELTEGDDDKYPEEVKLLGNNKRKLLEGRLIKCIEHHCFLRKFVRLADDLFNPNVLVDYLHAIISIAFLLLEVTVAIKSEEWGRFSHSLQYLLLSIGHMYMFYWLGSELSLKEESLGEAAAGLPWYKFSSEKHKIILSSLVSVRPHKLTGGKTFRITLEFFTTTMKVVFSYFAFLLQLRKNQTQIEIEDTADI